MAGSDRIARSTQPLPVLAIRLAAIHDFIPLQFEGLILGYAAFKQLCDRRGYFSADPACNLEEPYAGLHV